MEKESWMELMTSVIHQKSSVKIIPFGMVTDGTSLGLMMIGKIRTETSCQKQNNLQKRDYSVFLFLASLFCCC